MVEMIEVESSNIKAVGWANNTLYVDYLNGTKYLYESVERETYLKLLGSRSRGQFMNTEIKGKYNYKRI